MIAYLDTHIATWLGQGQLKSLAKDAKRIIDRADLLISPIVVLELEFLYELGRVKRPVPDILLKLDHELGARVCDLSFPSIANSAVNEKWTRDPFDRIIVAHAKTNGFAALISADEHIAKHYPRTVW